MKKKTPLNKSLKLIQILFTTYKWKIIIPVVCNIIGSIMGGLNPFIIGLAINELGNNVLDINNNVPGATINLTYILFIVVLLFASAVIRQGLTYLGSYLLGDAVQESFRDLRTTINNKINTLPVSYFDHHQHGEILSTITNDVDTVSNAILQSVLPLIYAFSTIFVTFIMMIYLSPKLGTASIIYSVNVS